MLLSFLETGLEASSKKKSNQNENPQPQSIVFNMGGGPTNDPKKSVCPVCPNFTCPMPSPTAPSGCTGPNCTGCTPAPFCCVNVANVITSNTTLNILNAEILGNAVVALNADVKDDFTVQEKAIFVGNVCVEGDKNVCENVTIDGFGVVLGTLTVNTGGISASGTIFVTGGNSTINGSLTVSGDVGITGNLSVGGSGVFNGTLTASGGLEVNNGSTINNGGLIIDNPSGCTGCTGAIINGNVCVVGDVVVGGDVIVQSELTVDQLATLNNVFVATGSTFITNDQVILNDGLTITGDETLDGGSKFVGDSLMISGSTILEGPVYSNSGATIDNKIVVRGGSTVDDLVLTVGSLYVSGTLNVNDTITSDIGLSVLSDVIVIDTRNSYCPSGPAALTVLGGVGIGATGPFTGAVGRDLWLGGSEYFANVSSEGGVPTSFDYYEETCYSTAFTWGGLTVNPATYVDVRVIRVGNIVNLLIPEIIYYNPGIHIDVLTATDPMPDRFRPFTTVRGPASTIISNLPVSPFGSITPGEIIGGLGEYDISPKGIITFGLPASVSGPLGNLEDALSPQRIFAQDFVAKDSDTITYNINSCLPRCKPPCP